MILSGFAMRGKPNIMTCYNELPDQVSEFVGNDQIKF